MALMLITAAGTQKAHTAPTPTSRRPLRVATRVPRSAADAIAQRTPRVFLGEGWGCVRFESEVGPVAQAGTPVPNRARGSSRG